MRHAGFSITSALFVFMLVFNVSAQDVKTDEAYYAGDKACGKCHTAAMKSFPENIHTKAYEVLKEDERYEKLIKDGKLDRCFPCHVTGYGVKGGFVSEEETPEMAKISCEGCHGPGSEHIKQDKNDTDAMKKTIKRYPECWRCHRIHRHEE